MDHARAQVVLTNTNGIARDNVVNDFAFQCDPATADNVAADQIAAALINFYNTVPPAGTHGNQARWIGEQISRTANACHIKVTDVSGHLNGSAAGSPILDQPWTLGAPSGAGSFPDEVAVVVTLRGLGWDTALVEGGLEEIPTPRAAQRMGAPATHLGNRRPRQSRCGKLYVGPLMVGVNDSAPAPGVVGDSIRLGLLDSARQLVADALAHGHSWSTWSRRTAAMHPIVRVEVDNAYDTQRRRGHHATLRSGVAV